MVTTQQIDAALGLLSMRRSELAQALGINTGTFNTYFTGSAEMKASRKQQVQQWLENAGIVFTDRGGVEPAQEIIRVFRGQSGFQDFMMHVYETCRDVGGDVFVTNVDEALFDKWAGDDFIHNVYLKNMHSLPEGQFKFHTIISEGDDYKPSNKYTEYKSIPNKYFSPVPTYIYGNNMANIIFMPEDVIVRVYDQKELVDAQRKLLLFIWNHASDLRKTG